MTETRLLMRRPPPSNVEACAVFYKHQGVESSALQYLHTCILFSQRLSPSETFRFIWTYQRCHIACITTFKQCSVLRNRCIWERQMRLGMNRMSCKSSSWYEVNNVLAGQRWHTFFQLTIVFKFGMLSSCKCLSVICFSDNYQREKAEIKTINLLPSWNSNLCSCMLNNSVSINLALYYNLS